MWKFTRGYPQCKAEDPHNSYGLKYIYIYGTNLTYLHVLDPEFPI